MTGYDQNIDIEG